MSSGANSITRMEHRLNYHAFFLLKDDSGYDVSVFSAETLLMLFWHNQFTILCRVEFKQ